MKDLYTRKRELKGKKDDLEDLSSLSGKRIDEYYKTCAKIELLKGIIEDIETQREHYGEHFWDGKEYCKDCRVLDPNEVCCAELALDRLIGEGEED